MNAAPPLPRRPGPPPRTTAWAPHIQQDQLAPAEMVAALAERVFAFADVDERPGTVAHPAERAIWLSDEIPAGPTEAFLGNPRSATSTPGTEACTSRCRRSWRRRR